MINMPIAFFNSMSVLHVAEKPSAATAIAGILSNHTATVRRTAGCTIYEFVSTVAGRRSSNVVLGVWGHLFEYEFANISPSWQQTDPIQLFHASVKSSIKQPCKQLAKTIQTLARKASKLVIWTDNDREGEAIGFEIIELCQVVKPDIISLRAKFSALTVAEITGAMENLVEPDRRKNESVIARTELDLRSGAAFTRALTLWVSGALGVSSVISYGPCQIPTLGFIVDRWCLIKNFVGKFFWTIDATLTADIRSVHLTWVHDRVYDLMAAHVMFEDLAGRLSASRGLVAICGIEETTVSRIRPIPLCTITLLKLASIHLKFSSDKTMKIAEKLYNSGVLSYPRTDTQRYPQSVSTRNIAAILQSNSVFGEYARNLRFMDPLRGPKDDAAHPPIHPVRNANPRDIEADEWKLYELVARHFLATCSDDARGLNRVARFKVGNGEDYEFSFASTLVLEQNWLEIFRYETWNSTTLPVGWGVGTHLPLTNLEVVERQTQPPHLLSEADLLSLMEKNEIGTDATMHEHIRKVIERGYTEKIGAVFSPTPLGVGLIFGFLSNPSTRALVSPKLRAAMERQLNLLAEGQIPKQGFLEENILTLRLIFSEFAMNANQFINSARSAFEIE